MATVHTCDQCSVPLEGYDRFTVSIGLGPKAEFCVACAQPYVALLTKANLLQEPLARRGYLDPLKQPVPFAEA